MSNYTMTSYATSSAAYSRPASSYSFAAISPPISSSYYNPDAYPTSKPYFTASSSYFTPSSAYYTHASIAPASTSSDVRAGVMYYYVQSNNTWSLLWASETATPSSSISPVQSVESAQNDKPNGLPLPAIVGVVIASIFIIVAIVVGRMWVRHRRAKAARQDARNMREIGRGDGGVWAFEQAPAPVTRVAPVIPQNRRETRDSTSVWSDDSEMDMMATDGSTLARTLSSRSTSSDATIRTAARQVLDHPGYTYRPAAPRSALLPSSSGHSSSPHTLRSPFSDPTDTTSTSPSTTLPRAESRLSTTSSENPFRDPLPAYTVEEAGRAPPELLSGVPVMGDGLERALQRPPPAYAERDRAPR